MNFDASDESGTGGTDTSEDNVVKREYDGLGNVSKLTAMDQDGNGNLSNALQYVPGNGGDIVVVRAFYEWPIYVRLLGNDLANMPGGKRLLAATAAFRNEPFPW